MDKVEEIKNLINSKVDSEERAYLIGLTSGSIICTLAKQLIKDSGYSVAATLLKRMRRIGRKDAKRIMEMFEIKDRNTENAVKVIKIAAMIIGLKYEVRNGKMVTVKCPYGDCVKESNEPFLCNICTEYARGLVEETLGSNFTFVRTKRLTDGDEYCASVIRKRI